MPVSVIVEKIDKLDRVQQWRQKSNTFAQALGQAATIISESESLNDLFIQDFDNTIGLSFAVTSGRIRNRADITDIAAAILVLPDSQLSYVYIDTIDNTIKSAIVQPVEDAIPLYEVTTDSIGITLVEDKRTWASINTDAEQVESFPIIEIFHLSSPTDIVELKVSKTINATVYVDGYRKVISDDYLVLSETEIKFPAPLPIGTTVLVAGTVPETEVKTFTSLDFKVATTPNQTEFTVTSIGQLTANVAVWVEGIRQHDFTLDFVNNKVILSSGVGIGTEVLIAKIEIKGGTFVVYDGNDGDIVYKVGSSIDVWEFAPPAFDGIAIISGVFDPIRIPIADANDIGSYVWSLQNDRFITPDILDDYEEEANFNDWYEVPFGNIEDFYMTGFNGRSVTGDYLGYDQSPTEIKCVRYGKVVRNPEFEEVNNSGFGDYFLKNAPFMIADSTMIRNPAVRYSAPQMILVGEYGGNRLAVLPTITSEAVWASVPTPFGSGWEIIGLGTFNYQQGTTDGDETIFVSGYNKSLNRSAVYKRAASQFPSGVGAWTLVASYTSGSANNKITKFSATNGYYGSPLLWAVANRVYGFHTFNDVATNNVRTQIMSVSPSREATVLASVCSYNNVNISDSTGIFNSHFFYGDDLGNLYYKRSQRFGVIQAPDPLDSAWTSLGNLGVGTIRHISFMFEPDGLSGLIVIISGEAGTKTFFESRTGDITLTNNKAVSFPIQQAVDSTLTYFHNFTSHDTSSYRSLIQDKSGDLIMHHYGSGGHTDTGCGRFPVFYKAFTHEMSPAPKISTRGIVRGKGITMILADYPVNAVWVHGKGIDYVKPISSGSRNTRGIWFINNTFVIITRETFIMSTDGLNWTETVFSNQLRNETYPVQLAYGNGKWVIANGIKTRYSTDGITWVNLDDDIPENILRNVIFDGTQFVGIDNTNQILTSTNGFTWNVVGSQTLKDIIYNEYYGGYIGIDTDDTSILFSTDLINWTMTKSIAASVSLVGTGKHIFVRQEYEGTYNNILIKNLNTPYDEDVDYYAMPLNSKDVPTEVFQDGRTFLVGIKTINNITGRLPVYYEAKL